MCALLYFWMPDGQTKTDRQKKISMRKISLNTTIITITITTGNGAG
ncbi:thr operon leader peptide [Pantoea anthophila]